jgi:hypothetical protein
VISHGLASLQFLRESPFRPRRSGTPPADRSDISNSRFQTFSGERVSMRLNGGAVSPKGLFGEALPDYLISS